MHRLKFLLLGGACLATVALIIFSLRSDRIPAPPSDHTGSSSAPSVAASSGSVRSSTQSAVTAFAYSAYDPKRQERGSFVVFFMSAQDPFSAAHDALLQSLSASGALKLPTYHADFGSATGARLALGVFVPDTFVVLGGSGQRLSISIHPSDDDVRSLVTAARRSPPSK